MRAHLPRAIGAAAALLMAAAGTMQAQGKHNEHWKNKDKERVVQREIRREDQRDDRRDDRREARRELQREVGRNNDGRVYIRPRDPRVVVDPRYGVQYRRVPPGLANRPGGLPPGQYKRLYASDQGANVLRDVLGRRGYTVVRTQPVGTSEYVYYRLRDGATQRAIVSPGRERLQFGNVPSSLLSEVLARLY
jgi:hypothetical protein